LLHGLQKYFGFISDDIVQAGIALAGGGIRSTTGSCGAFSAGLLALSAKFSPRSDEPNERELREYERAREKYAEFRDWFIAEFGGVVCKEVQHRQLGRSFNLMDDQEYQAFKNFQGVGEKCNQVSRKSALKVAEILSRSETGSE
jgi:hypothetical protein